MMPTKVVKPLRTTLIITYATTGNMANLLYYTNAFLKAGFDVVLFDYRGFGHSSDFPKDPACLYYNEYVTDMETAIDAARKQFPTNKLGIVSSSAGTILTTLAVQQKPVDFIVGEGYVRDPFRIIDIWKKKDSSFKIVLPADADRYVEVTRKITCPMLLMTGTKDDITPPSNVHAIADMRSNRKLLLYDGQHLEAITVWKEKEFADGYVRRIKEFVSSLR
ncbi:alpha/beta hydrolase [Spirosoma spitsbergense]|uniref:alpha/beta hydrolase n=1 Tax=Spirosoma spitsbergense TaxID=431554 RepID=UPI0003A37EC8|nr:alpha/beta fold hydrolase [Spirosoma spitsbergense]